MGLQNEIDKVYALYHDEMNRLLQSKNVHPKVYKRFKRSTKPFWNDNLSSLWKTLCEKEKLFLLCSDRRRRYLQQKFVLAQKKFDREYRKAERKYRINKIDEIDNYCTSDPNKFWDSIKRLGPRKKSGIPMEVYGENQNIITDQEQVLNKWKSEFERLFNLQPDPGQFDDDFYNECITELNAQPTVHVAHFPELDHDIQIDEVIRVIKHARNNKSVGIDNFPYEIFKNAGSEQILTSLFDKIYKYHLTPSVWNLSIIKPLPKNASADLRIPLEYRGISLLSTVYTLFTSVLNNRIVNVSETHGLYADEQNGFWKDRSCADHLFSLTSIIRNRKRDRLSTYVAFVDFEKAFDRVDRNLLFYKLNSMGLGGKMLNMLKNIYSNCESCVNLNGYLTNTFPSKYGVRQGDTLSPTLFGLFINDLADDLNASGKGIKLNEYLTIALFLYADDLAIMAESEEDLQVMLPILDRWCKKWRMRVNVSKTKIVHFRTTKQPRTTFQFNLNNETVECVDKYKYLGIILDEHLNFNVTASVLASSANRALGSIYTRFNKLKGLGLNTFTTLFNSGIAPILDYCAGIWGSQKHEQIDTVQNRAIRFFLGVHKFAPNLAINGDMGWVSSGNRRNIEMFRYSNRIIKMDPNRITKTVFTWDVVKRRSVGSWNSDILKLFSSLNMGNIYHNLMEVNLTLVKEKLLDTQMHQWETNIVQVPKLRTYCTFKRIFSVEPYVYKVVNRAHRSILAQFRNGILPLKIETGRYTQIPIELCILCNEDQIENECQFLFEWLVG